MHALLQKAASCLLKSNQVMKIIVVVRVFGKLECKKKKHRDIDCHLQMINISYCKAGERGGKEKTSGRFRNNSG